MRDEEVKDSGPAPSTLSPLIPHPSPLIPQGRLDRTLLGALVEAGGAADLDHLWAIVKQDHDLTDHSALFAHRAAMRLLHAGHIERDGDMITLTKPGPAPETPYDQTQGTITRSARATLPDGRTVLVVGIHPDGVERLEDGQAALLHVPGNPPIVAIIMRDLRSPVGFMSEAQALIAAIVSSEITPSHGQPLPAPPEEAAPRR